MKRGYKYRIYPTEEQKQYIDLCIKGNVWFWNYALYKIDDHYNNTKKHLSAKYNIAKDLPILKKNFKMCVVNNRPMVTYEYWDKYNSIFLN